VGRAFRWISWSLGLTLVVQACSTPSFVPGACTGEDCAGSANGGSSGSGSGSGGKGGKGGSSTGGSSLGNAGEGGEEQTTGGTGGSDPGTGGAVAGGSSGGSPAGGRGGSPSSGSGGSGGSDPGGMGGTGGSDTGGSSGSVGAGMGGGGSGGAGGLGGAGVGGLGGAGALGGVAGLGVAGGISLAFPNYDVLDDFNRPGPELGSNWEGSTGNYWIESNALYCSASYCPGLFYHQEFGVTQEAFVTLSSFLDAAPEINVVLKAQGDPDCDMVEVLYSPATQRVLIEACWDGSWNPLGEVFVQFFPGDQLGGRVRSDGFVEVYKNGAFVQSFDANDYPYILDRGHIGVNGVTVNGAPDIWDDFGGGGG